jgi:threonyl-tRNA synthetase
LPSRCGWDSVGVQKEAAEGVISVRRRKEGDKGNMSVADFLKMTEEDRKVVR